MANELKVPGSIIIHNMGLTTFILILVLLTVLVSGSSAIVLWKNAIRDVVKGGQIIETRAYHYLQSHQIKNYSEYT